MPSVNTVGKRRWGTRQRGYFSSFFTFPVAHGARNEQRATLSPDLHSRVVVNFTAVAVVTIWMKDDFASTVRIVFHSDGGVDFLRLRLP